MGLRGPRGASEDMIQLVGEFGSCFASFMTSTWLWPKVVPVLTDFVALVKPRDSNGLVESSTVVIAGYRSIGPVATLKVLSLRGGQRDVPILESSSTRVFCHWRST